MPIPTTEAVLKSGDLTAIGHPNGTLKSGDLSAIGHPNGALKSGDLSAIGHPNGALKSGDLVAFRIITGPVTVPGLPFASSLSRRVATHFTEAAYTGRLAGRAARPAPSPAPPQPTAFGGLPRLLRAIAQHHAPAGYAGRTAAPSAGHAYGGGVGLPARVASLSLETLLRGNEPQVRVASLALETLAREIENQPVRASQFLAEVLGQVQDAHFVRAAAFRVEVLIPRTELPLPAIYPALVGLTYSVIKTPKFSTGIGTASSGREVRVSYWSTPQWEWELKYDLLGDGTPYVGTTASDLKTLVGFFLSVYGAGLPFYYQDPDDNIVTNQVLAIGDGITTSFVFSRTYGLGSFTGTEHVGTVDTRNPVTIYVNGVAQTSGVTVSTATPCGNFVQFATAPTAGATITATFSFMYLCRLKEDSNDFEKIMKNLWQQGKITIFSLKN